MARFFPRPPPVPVPVPSVRAFTVCGAPCPPRLPAPSACAASGGLRGPGPGCGFGGAGPGLAHGGPGCGPVVRLGDCAGSPPVGPAAAAPRGPPLRRGRARRPSGLASPGASVPGPLVLRPPPGLCGPPARVGGPWASPWSAMRTPPSGQQCPPVVYRGPCWAVFLCLDRLLPLPPRPSPSGGRVRRVQHTPCGGADPRHGRGRKNLDGASPVQVNKTSIYFVDLIHCFNPWTLVPLLSLHGASIYLQPPNQTTGAMLIKSDFGIAGLGRLQNLYLRFIGTY